MMEYERMECIKAFILPSSSSAFKVEKNITDIEPRMLQEAVKFMLKEVKLESI